MGGKGREEPSLDDERAKGTVAQLSTEKRGHEDGGRGLESTNTRVQGQEDRGLEQEHGGCTA